MTSKLIFTFSIFFFFASVFIKENLYFNKLDYSVEEGEVFLAPDLATQ